ncbi:TonB-dependent receptor [Flavobacterium supellecticarium]|uniref:TonB-dependent receptor n=1 Tax=Flavobacterium supellecticarium TaxID=2565924 RepID=A0A4S3ZVR6_9FLAO|nr:TonB-dependent receptor [Flavobacterium supellecticarium]THF49847.1 TonB-dependent receptor [Flavobacterium supellecticarium]
MRLKLLFALLFLSQLLLAQNDTINLNEVIVSDVQLRDNNVSQTVLKLNDSIIQQNQPALTSLLNYNSVIYFKENGYGMVSSASFRGTTAQQTAVLWNGININSQLLGQTDFNTVTTRDFNSISVKSGGGSVVYGSGAIGGTVHLNTDFRFREAFQNELYLGYGSFNTINTQYRLNAGTKKWNTQISFSRNSSDNDYPFVGSDEKNTNGEYYNATVNANIGYKINDKNSLKLYSQFYEDERHFSITSENAIRTKYRNTNSRNLLVWTNSAGQFTSNVKAAFLKERYQYYDNIQSDNFSFGEVQTFIAKYDVVYAITENIKLNAIIDYTINDGEGEGIGEAKRKIGSGVVLFKHKVSDAFTYEVSGRKEITDAYQSPFLFSAGATCAVTNWYKVKLNGSHNFRIPTFNDLYWKPGGNLNLRPESAYQADLGQEFSFGGLRLTATAYYMKIKDMLRWLPTSEGYWAPVNTDRVQSYGAEVLLDYTHKIGSHELGVKGTYAYTVSEDENTNKQLIYVPYHKLTGAVSYAFKNFGAYYQALYNGEVFTLSDNDPKYMVKDYLVSNFGIDYRIGKKNTYRLGAQVRNLTNEKYESVASRLMPGRNYNVTLTLIF